MGDAETGGPNHIVKTLAVSTEIPGCLYCALWYSY